MNTKTFFAVFAFSTCLGGVVAAQDRPPGWETSGCQADRFSAVLMSDGSVGYWTNPTCPAAADGGTPMLVIAPARPPMEQYDAPQRPRPQPPECEDGCS